MKRSFGIFVILPLLLAACGVDTTGISPSSTKGPHGNPQSSVVLVEYGDFECPACRVANEVIVKPLYKKYSSRVRFEFRQFPLQTVHRYAMPLAEASECAADQGKFWEFVDKAYDMQLKMDEEEQQLKQADITTWAKDLGLDMSLFDRCTRSHIKRKAILSEFEAGRKQGVKGTPTFIVNGKSVRNDLNVLSAEIDAALAGGGSVPRL